MVLISCWKVRLPLHWSELFYHAPGERALTSDVATPWPPRQTAERYLHIEGIQFLVVPAAAAPQRSEE